MTVSLTVERYYAVCRPTVSTGIQGQGGGGGFIWFLRIVLLGLFAWYYLDFNFFCFIWMVLIGLRIVLFGLFAWYFLDFNFFFCFIWTVLIGLRIVLFEYFELCNLVYENSLNVSVFERRTKRENLQCDNILSLWLSECLGSVLHWVAFETHSQCQKIFAFALSPQKLSYLLKYWCCILLMCHCHCLSVLGIS